MRISRPWLILLSTLLLVGCRAEETIEQYEVTHPDREMIELRVAIVPHEKHVWFFHLSGPEPHIKEHAPVLEDLVKTIQFDDKKEELPVTWTEPKANTWIKETPVGERIASYRIETRPKAMEMKVTAFPADKYSLIANLHRWQQKLNLPLCDEKDTDKFATVAKVGNLEVTWVKLKALGVHALSKPMPAAQPKKKAPPRPVFKQKAKEVPFEYEVPKGWEEKAPRDEFTRVLLEVADGDKMALVTFTQVGGALPLHINRWRGQVKLPPVSDEEAVRSAKRMKIAGIDSHYVDIANPNGPAKLSRIVVAIVPLGEATWFVRMSGPHDWVGQNIATFESFVKTMKRAP